MLGTPKMAFQTAKSNFQFQKQILFFSMPNWCLKNQFRCQKLQNSNKKEGISKIAFSVQFGPEAAIFVLKAIK